MSYGFFPSFGLQLPSTPLAQGYTPMLEGGIRSVDVAPVGTGQVNQDMSLNDRTQQVLDQANEILAQPQISPFQQFVMDEVDPLGLFGSEGIFSQPQQTPQAVTAPIENITPREEAGPKSYARKGEMPEVAFSPDFGFDIFPEGFYGQSEVRGTEAGPPEFGQEEVQQDQDTTIEPTAEETQPDTAGSKGYQRKKGVDNSARELVQTSMDEYLKLARPGVEPGTYDDYIKEFGEATGLDVSGEPDNKMALMAFGLALMQNKAGKGFDVGEMLSSVGEAGEKAMPALQKAKEQAQAIRAKAGEYAISRKKEDQAAAMNRQSVFIVPRTASGKDATDKLRNRLMQGSYYQLNSYELNALANSESFEKNYEIMPGDVLSSMNELFKAPESPYKDTIVDMPLFAGAPDEMKVKTYAPKPGYSSMPSRYISSSEEARAASEIESNLASLDRIDSDFQSLFQSFEDTPPTNWAQLSSSFTGFGRSFGFGIPEDFNDLASLETDVQFQKRFSEYLATRFAPEILQEAGKTISDADRQRVQAIVGEISLLTDPATTAARLRELHEFIVLAGRAKMENAILNHNRLGGSMGSSYTLSADEQARYKQLQSKYKIAPQQETTNQPSEAETDPGTAGSDRT